MATPQVPAADYAQLWETLAIQIHCLNDVRVVAMTGAFFHSLDHGGRRYMQDRMSAFTQSENVFFVRDGMHPSRWLLGDYEDLQSVPGSAIYMLDGVPTLALGGHCPYPGQSVADAAGAADAAADTAGDGVSTSDAPDVSVFNPNPGDAGAPDTVGDAAAPDTVGDAGAPDTFGDAGAPDTFGDAGAAPVKISRPPNAYILYRKDKHRAIETAHPGIRNNEISVIAGSMWNTESAAVRAEYGDKADALKARHKAMYPDYKYAPRRPEQVKRRKRGGVSKVPSKTVSKVPVSKPSKTVVGSLGESQIRALEAVSMEAPVSLRQPMHMDESAAVLETQSDVDEWNAACGEFVDFGEQ